jgi:hypothetical protein
MTAFLGQDARLPDWEESGVDTTGHYMLGLPRRIILVRYLPSSRNGAVLVTSRTKRAAMQVVEDSDIILVEPMHDIATHALLRKKLRNVDEKDDKIAILATTLDHMPLAFVQAVAYIRERAPRCSVQQYLEEHRQNDSLKLISASSSNQTLRCNDAGTQSIPLPSSRSTGLVRDLSVL